ncbi:potassium-transporting ATPase subunit C [Mycolicibacterium porcinum]|uniref:Potassium-transporting ATPase KdpC subunit n=1 Tax=Mycolicibacterium porcinum TaxID=39693 RepID=A0AAW5SYF8_9MYCO|nr:potassium-transporting ATPase subunit C [Mycolicibacterium porcinum]OCB46438.1 K+-transporting ATPase subunit C [Mycolicibacterium vulneris]MCV7388220.1 potassium-transporting ATPase subunit C [Mycolicibacterium porcinum]ODR25218.1 K+-transporting ATPase subunit C [Mycolicibacterium porcinum]ORB40494.1 K+-transporting ATPase subunit C [Mycolicibacterium porcinum]TVX97018.1 potassium-transporting ATPase subunit C [Mycolicibacterium porcinum]
MKFSNLLRQHAAALRALLVLTVILGIGYPVFIWLVAQIPGLRDKADGSLIELNGKPVGSSLIGQSFTDADGNPLPRYFQSRPSMAGDGYDPMATSASNLGPESVVDQPDKPSLLTQVCSRSAAVGELDGVDGARPFCTGGGVGAVLSVIGPRDARGNVVHPTQVVSVNEPCDATKTPFLNTYEGVRVECAKPGQDYSAGLIVPIRGSAPADPQVPADAVTASGSGLDPHISPAYADLQVNRVAKARGLNPDLVRAMVAQHTDGRTLGFFGEPRVNVLELNIALDSL